MSKDKMNILFLQVNNPGVCFYRMYQFAQKMSELGLAHCKMFPAWDAKRLVSYNWESKLEDHLPTIEPLAEWADAVVCQYIHSGNGLTIVQALRDLKPCFMEADDFFSQVPHYSLAYDENKPGFAQDIWATRQIMESTGVITTTESLKAHYQNWNPNVHVIPNCIDFDLWDQYKSVSHDRVRIGWIGACNHDGDLKIIRNVLYEILDAFPNVEVYMVSYPPPDWKKHDRMKLINSWATIDAYPRHVKGFSFDIGLAPLRDNYFNRGKSNLRYLEYSACGIPTVASNVESYKKNFSGLTAETDEDWFNILSKLIEDKNYRLEMGRIAYESVKRNFNLNDVSIRYYDVIRRQLGWHGEIFQDRQQLGVT